MIVLAQIGCGYWGPNLLRNFSSQSDCHVKWVVEQSPQRRAFVTANYPKTAAIADRETILKDPEVDGVVIATPASTHGELASEALRAGKHVFVEKPLTMNTREAEELGRIAGSTGRTLMVGHTFLYNAAVNYVKGLLDRGDMGRLYYVYCQRLNLGQVRSDVNAWWNLAPHDVSIMLHLMGGVLPDTVSAQGVAYIQPDIEDVVFAVLTWKNRVTAHIHVSWLDPGKVRRVTLVGERKMVVYDDVSDDKVAVIDKGVDRAPMAGGRMDYDQVGSYRLVHRAGDVWLPKVDFQEPLKTEAAHFLDCLRTGKTPLTGPRHARDTVAVLEAGQKSLREQGRLVTVQ